MFRKQDKTYKKLYGQLMETNHQLLENNRILVKNNGKIIDSLIEKDYRLEKAKLYSKMVINLWIDSKNEMAQCMVDNFKNIVNILDGEDK